MLWSRGLQPGPDEYPIVRELWNAEPDLPCQLRVGSVVGVRRSGGLFPRGIRGRFLRFLRKHHPNLQCGVWLGCVVGVRRRGRM